MEAQLLVVELQLIFEVTCSCRSHSLEQRKDKLQASCGLQHRWENQHPRDGCYPPLGREMSQTKPCFSAARISVQR